MGLAEQHDGQPGPRLPEDLHDGPVARRSRAGRVLRRLCGPRDFRGRAGRGAVVPEGRADRTRRLHRRRLALYSRLRGPVVRHLLHCDLHRRGRLFAAGDDLQPVRPFAGRRVDGRPSPELRPDVQSGRIDGRHRPCAAAHPLAPQSGVCRGAGSDGRGDAPGHHPQRAFLGLRALRRPLRDCRSDLGVLLPQARRRVAPDEVRPREGRDVSALLRRATDHPLLHLPADEQDRLGPLRRGRSARLCRPGRQLPPAAEDAPRDAALLCRRHRPVLLRGRADRCCRRRRCWRSSA